MSVLSVVHSHQFFEPQIGDSRIGILNMVDQNFPRNMSSRVMKFDIHPLQLQSVEYTFQLPGKGIDYDRKLERRGKSHFPPSSYPQSKVFIDSEASHTKSRQMPKFDGAT